ncbi:MAG: hypothetical protein ACYSSK_03090 [Planctomycetota bacterium]|jgi:hypothetical protein
MKLPDIENADRYTGLYVVDFGDHCGVGFVADEVAELLESEQFADVQVYKVHRANPDGTMELKGVNKETFQLEAGMFFHAADETTARADFQRLTAWADEQLPPARCKVHLAGSGDSFITALIYPAEYDDAFSRWLPAATQRYFDVATEIIERKNLWPASSVDYLHGEALMEATNRAIVR